MHEKAINECTINKRENEWVLERGDLNITFVMSFDRNIGNWSSIKQLQATRGLLCIVRLVTFSPCQISRLNTSILKKFKTLLEKFENFDIKFKQNRSPSKNQLMQRQSYPYSLRSTSRLQLTSMSIWARW